ncbi:hypothetical protein GCM10010269_76160 [Streptomyces humidus]|uniref:SCP2 domain-containing protein n=1 Tax=Streptomyces humidus TaxID=52259 RepID=A0A918LB95_9ACTN|nr:SCP2 sterol-binding domain-containing protein [Streptomyces humidus]GGS26336.1 hypothetical protein GCM10010269_76160 [Streptomyces humidus]
MGFADAAEVRKYIGGIFEAAFEDPEIGPKLRDTGIVLQFTFTEPDSVVVVDAVKATVGDSADGAAPGAVMSMAADTGNAYWQGKVNLPLAMAKSKIKVQGNVASLLKLAPLGKQLFPVYIETLRSDGRDDLIV